MSVLFCVCSVSSVTIKQMKICLDLLSIDRAYLLQDLSCRPSKMQFIYTITSLSSFFMFTSESCSTFKTSQYFVWPLLHSKINFLAVIKSWSKFFKASCFWLWQLLLITRSSRFCINYVGLDFQVGHGTFQSGLRGFILLYVWINLF